MLGPDNGWHIRNEIIDPQNNNNKFILWELT